MSIKRRAEELPRQRATIAESARVNNLLAALPDVELNHLLSGAEAVRLRFGEVLQEAGQRRRYVYFPLDTYISQIASLQRAPRIEVGLVGSEGMIGYSLFLGVRNAAFYTVVQGAGTSLRLEADRFVRELARAPALRALMGRYAYVRMSQLGQMVACARFHTVETRLARWLLMTRDRARSTTFRMTHEYMAFMLGVRRVGVTEAATLLQKLNVIEYSRGELNILNSKELEAASCECYATAEQVYREHME
jgi:CRP-like cAMP-binding protein